MGVSLYYLFDRNPLNITCKHFPLGDYCMKNALIGLLAALILVGCSGKVEKKAAYNYMEPKAVAEAIRTNAKVALVDIQEAEDFDEEHLKGAIKTLAYPVKTEEDNKKLLAALASIGTDDKVVVVCPRGGGGAERAYDLLAMNGIEKSRLYILTDGQYGWPRDSITDVIAQ